MRLGRATFRVEDPINLAVFRIVIAGLVLLSEEVRTNIAVQPVPPALFTPPEGLRLFAAVVPVTASLAKVARVFVVVSAASALVGFRSRTSFSVLTLSALYLFAIPQLAGSVRHDMHLLWFCLLLAVSPCGARLSVDALRRAETADPHPLWTTAPIWIARALFACVYFFPGFWKLKESGLAWALSDNLRNQMYWKWYQNGWLPSFRIDQHPWLLHALALSVLSFELGFPLLMWSRRLRALAVIGGLGFHFGADAFMRLGFSSLWWCYVVLIDIRAVVDWLHDEPSASPRTSWPEAWNTSPKNLVLLVALAGGLLVGGNVVQGFRGAMQSWPFSCYPTFQWRAATTMPDLLIAVVDADGRERALLEGPAAGLPRDQRRWALVWRVAGVYDPTNEKRLRQYLALARREHPAFDAELRRGARVRFYRAYYSVLPSEWRTPAKERTLLLETEPARLLS